MIIKVDKTSKKFRDKVQSYKDLRKVGEVRKQASIKADNDHKKKMKKNHGDII